MIWTDTRVEQFEKLQTLLRIAGSLNTGSHVVEKIKELEDLHDLLTRADRERAEPSFMSWLRDMISEDRKISTLSGFGA